MFEWVAKSPEERLPPAPPPPPPPPLPNAINRSFRASQDRPPEPRLRERKGNRPPPCFFLLLPPPPSPPPRPWSRSDLSRPEAPAASRSASPSGAAAFRMNFSMDSAQRFLEQNRAHCAGVSPRPKSRRNGLAPGWKRRKTVFQLQTPLLSVTNETSSSALLREKSSS